MYNNYSRKYYILELFFNKIVGDAINFGNFRNAVPNFANLNCLIVFPIIVFYLICETKPLLKQNSYILKMKQR